MDLITAAELAEHFQRDTETIVTAAARAGLSAMQVKYGRGTMAVFQREDALRALAPILRPPLVAQAPKRQDGADLTEVADILHRSVESAQQAIIKVVEASGADCEHGVGRALELVQKVLDQNILLMRAMNDLRAEFVAKVNALQASLDAALGDKDPAARPALPPAPPAPEVTKKKRLRVGIVSLLPAQKAAIEHEFAKVFDLRIVNSEDQRDGSRLESMVGSCDVILALTRFITHSTEASVRNTGTELIRINGGMTQLRDKLADLYVRHEDGAAAPVAA